MGVFFLHPKGKSHLGSTWDLPNASPSGCVPCGRETVGSAQKPTFCLATGNIGGMEGRKRGEELFLAASRVLKFLSCDQKSDPAETADLPSGSGTRWEWCPGGPGGMGTEARPVEGAGGGARGANWPSSQVQKACFSFTLAIYKSPKCTFCKNTLDRLS